MAAPAWTHVFTAALVVQLLISCVPSSHAQLGGGLKTGFYSSTCPNAEDTVRAAVEKYFADDPSIAPALLRLHFHDCFVQGCDGSVLIAGNATEMTAAQNTGVRGFDVVEDAKSQVEALCPGVVSCADILALAARDAVDLAGGPSWPVPTGRRDGRVSSASDAAILPSPFDSVEVQRQKFADKGLSDQDLVTLVGAHTIGQTSCRFVGYRLYNFTPTGSSDPTINQDFVGQLQTQCPPDGNPSQRVPLDRDTPAKFDVSFFKNVRDGRGALESDLLSRDDKGEALCRELGGPGVAIFVHCDVSDESNVRDAVDTAVATYGKLDVAFSNAGIVGSTMCSILEAKKEDFERVVAVNLTGAFLVTKHAARAMVPAGRGSIVITASVCGVVGGMAPYAYTSTKHAVVGLCREAAAELGRHGVRVNCVSPYLVATALAREGVGTEDDETVAAAAEAAANLKGVGLKTEDIAEAVLYLASDAARYVSGHNLVVDGGVTVVSGSLGRQ